MQHLPGETVQCVNPECTARGRWVRVQEQPLERCLDCGVEVHSVHPPLAPQALRMRMRARPQRAYRPMGRPR
jgi:hypothetical protein